MPITPVLRKGEQEEDELRANLGYAGCPTPV